MSKSKNEAAADDFFYQLDDLREISSQILAYAKARGASACELSISEGKGQIISVRNAELETIEHTRDKGLGVTIYLGQKKAHASSSDFSSKSWQQTVDAAFDIANYTSEDSFAGLADVELLAKDGMDLDLYHPWDLSVKAAEELAKEAEEAGYAANQQINNSEGATVSTHCGQFINANSLGFSAGFASSDHYISCTMIAESAGKMQRDYWYDSRRDYRQLQNAKEIGQHAGNRTARRLNARSLSTRVAPVIFEAQIAIGLIGSLVHAASGGAIYRQSSFLENCLGKQIFPDFVNLHERPHILKGASSTPFDADGVATFDREIVVNGVLNSYFLGVYSARKLNMKTTANAGGSHNLLLDPSPENYDLPELLANMRQGLLVTELLGHGINYVTGDYSRGAAGFWVENGEIAYPVEEITIAGNLREMFADIVAIGNDVFTKGSKQTGSIWLKQMKIAGE